MATEVRDDAERSQFVITLDGEQVGLAAYRRKAGQIAFTHTEIDPAHGGQGLAGTLIGFALDAARAEGLAVLPFCPFVRGFIRKHPDRLELVPAGRRAEFDLPEDATTGSAA